MLLNYPDVHSQKIEMFCKLQPSAEFEFNSVLRDEGGEEKKKNLRTAEDCYLCECETASSAVAESCDLQP